MTDAGAKKTRKRAAVPQNIKHMREVIEKAREGGDPDRVLAQKAKGKLTARERIHYLVDEDSFQELDLLVTTRCNDFGLQDKHIPGDGVITGIGRVGGREVAIFAQDFTVLGGSLGLAHANKICKIMDMAVENRVPVIGLLDSGGARIQEGVDSLDGYAKIFYRNTKASGVIPQISVILGPCAGGAVYSPALTDFVFMVEGSSHMFVTGPEVVKAATGETVTFDVLGGGMTHGAKSGNCHFLPRSEPDCFRQVRELISFLPQNRWEKPPRLANPDPIRRTTPLLEVLCEVDPRKPYRVHHVIWQLADEHKFFEVMHDFAKNIVIGFMRLGGDVVGVVANNPAHKAGAIDIDASDKAARFIRFLNTFNIPILTLVDVPGYWPGVEQEHGGIIRHGAKLLHAYAEATVPKVTVVLRKAYGGAYIAMSSKHMGADFNFALPCAEIAVMGPAGAIEILFSRKLKAGTPEEQAKLRVELTDDYKRRFASPYQTASTGSVDEVIEPSEVRHKIARAFRFLENKRQPGEHDNRGNIPL
ncbi:MAG: methylmalonyl-CoA carboxyltransferase [Elusimicrobia bacterium GWA2_69_24]|nr:MAG: methylmalonyl-CoA carboxyltransferase [Elusimicrobia bacterium GWA2_69_24]HBL15744.1 methylmalonyl-CoA carboxyltransferase [Elusimicrobiota bacterium]